MNDIWLCSEAGPQRKIEVFCFDLWETLIELVDCVDLRVQAMKEGLEAMGDPRSEEAIWSAYETGRKRFEAVWQGQHRFFSAADRVDLMLEELSARLTSAARADCVKAFEEVTLLRPPRLLHGVGDLLAWLAARIPIVLVCDSGLTPGRVLRKILDDHGVLKFFSHTIFSDEMGVTKPEPEMFLKPLRSLGIAPEEAVHIGDNPKTDVAGALSLGMGSVWINTGKFGGLPPGLRPDLVVSATGELSRFLWLETSSGDASSS